MTRILLIDDDPSVIRALRKFLEPEGYEVMEAPDGRVGLQVFRERPADLVVTDLFMPEMDGFVMIDRLRHEFPRVPIVAISGGGWERPADALEVARQLGAVQTIEKPFSRELILAVVREALGQVGSQH